MWIDGVHKFKNGEFQVDVVLSNRKRMTLKVDRNSTTDADEVWVLAELKRMKPQVDPEATGLESLDGRHV